jgi:hypothetical protein
MLNDIGRKVLAEPKGTVRCVASRDEDQAARGEQACLPWEFPDFTLVLPATRFFVE